MSSVSSAAPSRFVATGAHALLSVGRSAGDDLSGAAFAVRPAGAAQDPEPDAPPPGDEVIITADAINNAVVVPDPAAAHSAAALSAAQADQVVPLNAGAVDERMPLAPANYNATPASQAAYAYAQTMQAWLESKIPRPVPVRRSAKPKADTER